MEIRLNFLPNYTSCTNRHQFNNQQYTVTIRPIHSEVYMRGNPKQPFYYNRTLQLNSSKSKQKPAHYGTTQKISAANEPNIFPVNQGDINHKDK